MENTAILLVDDEKSILKALKRTLFEYPYKITSVSSALEARDYLSLNKVDMVISDFKMPTENGFELLNYIKNNYPDIIRIMLSGYVDKDVIFESLFTCAALTTFPKPWDEEKLINRISRLLELKNKMGNKKIWELINSGVLFKPNSALILELKELLVNNVLEETIIKYVSSNMFLLFRLPMMVYSDYFNYKEKFNILELFNLIGLKNIIKLLENSPNKDYSSQNVYEIMPDIFNKYYKSVLTELSRGREDNSPDIPLPFFYLHNYLYLKLDEKNYHEDMNKLINKGKFVLISDSITEAFKFIVDLHGLPEVFLNNYKGIYADKSYSYISAKKLISLVELFWWGDSMPESHPLFTFPGDLLTKIYDDVKRLQL